MGQVEEVKKNNKLLALIIRSDYNCDGIDIITPNEYSQQVAHVHLLLFLADDAYMLPVVNIRLV